MLWANLQIISFATGWLGENHFAPAPTALYGGVLLMAALACRLLQQLIIVSQGAGSLLKRAIGGDRHAPAIAGTALQALP